MRYFTSDLHLAHPFVAATRGFWRRGVVMPDAMRDMNINELRHNMSKPCFESIVDAQRHDETIVKRINSTVGKQDELYVLGDLSAGSTASLDAALRQIDRLNVPPARRHLVLGNHDGFHMRNNTSIMLANRFGSISDTLFITLEDGTPCILSHVPRRQYIDGRELPDTASNSLEKSLRKHAPVVPPGIAHLYGHTHGNDPAEFHDTDSVNVGLDAWSLRPVSETEILEHLKNRPHASPKDDEA